MIGQFFVMGGFSMVIPLLAVHYVNNLGWAAATIGIILAIRQFFQQNPPQGTYIAWLRDNGKLAQGPRAPAGVGSVIVSALGLPKEAANSFVIGFLRRDYGAAGLFHMQQQGQLDGIQTVVALAALVREREVGELEIRRRGWAGDARAR